MNDSHSVTPISKAGEPREGPFGDGSRCATASGETNRRVRAIGLGAWGIRGAELLSRHGVPARAVDTEPGVERAELPENRRHRIEVESAGERERVGEMARALAADPELGAALATDAATDLVVVVANLAVGAGALTATLLRRLEEAAPRSRRLVVARLPGPRSGPDERALGLVALNAVLKGPPTSVLLVQPSRDAFEVDPHVPLAGLLDLWALTSGSDGDPERGISPTGLIGIVSTPGFFGWRAVDLASGSVGADGRSWHESLAGSTPDWQTGGFDWSRAQTILPMVRMPRGWLDEGGRKQFERFVESAWDEAAPCSMTPVLYAGDSAVAMLVSAGMPYPEGVLALRDGVREDRERLAEKREAARSPIPLDDDFLFEGAEALVDSRTIRPSDGAEPALGPEPTESAFEPEPEPEPAGRDEPGAQARPERGPRRPERAETGPPAVVEEEAAPEPGPMPWVEPETETASEPEPGAEPIAGFEPEPEPEPEPSPPPVPDLPELEPGPVPEAYETVLALARRILDASDLRAEVDLAEVRYALYDLLEILREEPGTLLPEVFRPEKHEYFARHHVNVAVLSILTADRRRGSLSEVIDLGTSALLHDIGMVSTRETWDAGVRLPPKVFDRAIKPHPEIGFERLQEIPGMTGPIARVVLEEHERMDGTGYPEGLEGDDIDPGARIMAVCDTLEALTHPRPYRDALTPGEALARLQTLGRYTLDGTIVDALTAELVELLRDTAQGAETRR